MQPTFTLTAHAARMLDERRIEPRWVEGTLASPARVEADPSDASLLHRLARIPEFGSRVLRVVATTDDTPRVVTAFFDRSLRTDDL